MAVKKIFTSIMNSTSIQHKRKTDSVLFVYESEATILMKIDMEENQTSYIEIDLETLSELIKELQRIESKLQSNE
jgi:hypothetical protein